MNSPWMAPVDPAAFRADYWKSVDWKAPFGTERPVALSPAAAAQEHYSQGALMYRFISEWEPWEYTGYHDESMAFHETAYLGDWSGLPKFHITGPDSVEFLSRYCANSFKKFEIGQLKHSIQTNEAGKVVGEGILCRLPDGSFRYSGGGAYWLKGWFDRGSWDAEAALVNPDVFVFAIQGPNSLFVIEKVLGESVRDVGFSRSRAVTLAGHELLLLRSGVSGELGYELQGPSEYANEVWTLIAETGAEFGIRQLGGRSQLISHVEHGFATIGRDFWPATSTESTKPSGSYRLNAVGGSYEWTSLTEFNRSPVELGWAGSVSTDHEYIGSDVIAREKATGTEQTMVGLEWSVEDVVDVYAAQFREGALPTPFEMPRAMLHHWLNPDQVLVNGRLVGCSTSRAYSTYLRRMISLAVMDRELAEPGTEVSVLWGDQGTPQHEIRATVRPLPMKDDNRRIDVSTLKAPPMS